MTPHPEPLTLLDISLELNVSLRRLNQLADAGHLKTSINRNHRVALLSDAEAAIKAHAENVAATLD